MFIGDDLYGVGEYNTETKEFTIDRQEISDSVEAYISYLISQMKKMNKKTQSI